MSAVSALLPIPPDVQAAILCGPEIAYRDWREGVDPAEWTRAERVMAFIEDYLPVPEGTLVGQPIHLEPFQEIFIYLIYDNPDGTAEAHLSISKKNGKTALIACILMAHLVGPEATLNSQIISGAMSRDQAALVFNAASKMVELSDDLMPICRIIPSNKKIIGLTKNVTYWARSSDASTAQGVSPIMAILDEVGQVRGPRSDFVNAIQTAQGAYEEPLLIAISTEAPSAADMFSIWQDDAVESQDPTIISMRFAADEKCKLEDQEQWRKSNPALGIFRSRKDLKRHIEKAARMPSYEASVRNLFLNQRIAQEGLAISPAVWVENSEAPNLEIFTVKGAHIRKGKTALALDLSARNDLTAGVLAACDKENFVHMLPFCFTPKSGLKERSETDRTPYDLWVEQGFLIAIPGRSLDYETVCTWLKDEFEDNQFVIGTIEFDRWRIDDFRTAARKVPGRFGPVRDRDWCKVGQGYQDFSPRWSAFESLLLSNLIKHGGHPLLTMAASNAIAVKNPAGEVKLDKSKSTQRIDPIIAAVMAAYAVTEGAKSKESTFNDPDRETIM